jgi:hypothetical protein
MCYSSASLPKVGSHSIASYVAMVVTVPLQGNGTGDGPLAETQLHNCLRTLCWCRPQPERRQALIVTYAKGKKGGASTAVDDGPKGKGGKAGEAVDVAKIEKEAKTDAVSEGCSCHTRMESSCSACQTTQR